MPKFEEIVHEGTCDVCGKQTGVVVCCSSCGPISFSYCHDCLENGFEPYRALVACISSIGKWPDDVNPNYQEFVRKNLSFHNKTEEEFIADLNNIY